MAAGSWLRYIIGIVLSLDVLRTAFTQQLQPSTIALAVIFLILAALYVVKRI